MDRYLLEDGTGFYLLEDDSGYYGLNEVITANPLAPAVEDCAYVAAADGWPTAAEVVAYTGRTTAEVNAFIAQLESEGSIHVGGNGKIRVRPDFRTYRW